ncbi:MAG: preprotein translocase subunit YajC [Eubacteriaceae bacterium]|nr:preprotein translocase subunit YajC [Eubacteriaceae bacterium]
MGGNNGTLVGNIVMLVAVFAAFYFFLIRPQKKKDRSIQDMRNNLQVGDEVVTIGGICGKIVKTKADTIVIQVGADRVKFEMMRWAISSVTSTKNAPKQEEEAPKKVVPKRLKKDDVEPVEEEVNAPEEN